jgi:hypothetical protein
VSVLEGGYNLRGGIVSAFSRSVAAHVRAMAEPHAQVGQMEAPKERPWGRGAAMAARNSTQAAAA